VRFIASQIWKFCVWNSFGLSKFLLFMCGQQEFLTGPDIVGKGQCKIVLVQAIKTYEGVDIELHSFLTSVRDGSGWSDSCFGPFATRRRTSVLIVQKSKWTVEMIWTVRWINTSLALPLCRTPPYSLGNPLSLSAKGLVLMSKV
jgi:hypothetical protein